MTRPVKAALWVIGLIALFLVSGVALLAFSYWEATWDPVVNRADVALADWPADAPPVTVLLISDTHMAGPDMPPERLRRIVDEMNRLAPDLVVLAGDYISRKPYATRHYDIAESVAPLSGLLAPLGRVAVLGNHDHWAGTARVRDALELAGITVLTNNAARRGPLIVGGLDDSFTGHANPTATERAMDALGTGPRILLTHAPDLVRSRDFKVDALLAGHTHCGQVVLPFFGSLARLRDHRFGWLPCGRLDLRGTPLFVGAGLGTSGVPLRFGARPGVWLIRFGPRDMNGNGAVRLAPGTPGP